MAVIGDDSFVYADVQTDLALATASTHRTRCPPLCLRVVTLPLITYSCNSHVRVVYKWRHCASKWHSAGYRRVLRLPTRHLHLYWTRDSLVMHPMPRWVVQHGHRCHCVHCVSSRHSIQSACLLCSLQLHRL